MKAVVVYEAGGAEQLVYTDVPRPTIKDGRSLVKVRGFGINHSEIFTRQGLSPSVKIPRILGIECVGTVEETTEPERLPVGRRVVSIMGEMGRAFDGSYAEYVLIPNAQIYPVDTDLPWAELAAIPETYYTAFCSLENLRISAEHSVLVHGGASGVGVAALRLLRGKYPDMRIDGTTRRADIRLSLLAEGYTDIVIDRDGRLETERAYDRILELVGPAVIKDSMKHLCRFGILCSTGQLGGKWYLEQFDPIIDLAEDSYLTSFYSGNVREGRLNDLLDYIDRYRVRIRPEKIFSLSEIIDAHRYLESRTGFGKVVIVI